MAVSAKNRFAGQGQAAEPALGRSCDFRQSVIDIGGGDAGHGLQTVIEFGEGFPGPVVPRHAHGIAEINILGGPGHETAIGEDDFAVHAIHFQLVKALLRRLAGVIAQLFLADKGALAHLGLAEAFLHLPFLALGVDFNAGQPVGVFFRQTVDKNVRGFRHMAVAGNQEHLVGIVGARGPGPSLCAGGLQTPQIGFVNFVIHQVHVSPLSS